MSSQQAPVIVAVVPLFRPTTVQIAALPRLLGQVDRVIAVNDGSGDHSPLNSFPAVENAMTILHLPDNRGIARALNVGVQEAARIGATHVLTLDQDSRLAPDYVSAAMRTLERAAGSGVEIGGVGAGRIGPHRVEGATLLQGVRDGADGIQSGWLLPLDVIQRVGEFDEGLFIDCVDVDYLMRAARTGVPLVVTDECVIEHALGDDERVLNLLGRRLVFSYHPPFRRYYITRNRIIMLLRHGRARPRIMVAQALTAARIGALCLLLGRSRRAQLAAIWAGALDGLNGRRGPIPTRTMRTLARAT